MRAVRSRLLRKEQLSQGVVGRRFIVGQMVSNIYALCSACC